MLILNRRVGEAVMIFDNITVVVLGVKGGQVRLGFEADATVPIHREEVHERIKLERALMNASSEADRHVAKGASVRPKRERPHRTNARAAPQGGLGRFLNEQPRNEDSGGSNRSS